MKIFNLGILFFALVLLLQIPASAENLQEITLSESAHKEGILLDKQSKNQAKLFKITKEYYSLGSKMSPAYIVMKYKIENNSKYPIHLDITNGLSAKTVAKNTLDKLKTKRSKTYFKYVLNEASSNAEVAIYGGIHNTIYDYTVRVPASFLKSGWNLLASPHYKKLTSKDEKLIEFDVNILNSILDNESISLELQPNEEKSFIGLFDSSQSKEVFICPGPYVEVKLHNGDTFNFWIK